MKLSFNIDDIKYLELTYTIEGKEVTSRLALKEKRENDFIAIINESDEKLISTPQKAYLNFVTNDGLYKTNATLKEVIFDNNETTFIIENPLTLDYQQNREYFRILAEYDCIYTIETNDGIESFNATTYDISAGGVSILMNQNLLSIDDASILIFLKDGDLKSHLKFVRSEAFEGAFKLVFEYTDLSEQDFERLTNLCVKKQLSLL